MLGNHARTTVVIADDHPLYRDALSQAITARPDLELLAAATDGRSALEQIRELSPDVAVLDMRMPGLRGIDVVEALARDGSATRVLVLSAAQASAVVRRGGSGRGRLLVQGCRARRDRGGRPRREGPGPVAAVWRLHRDPCAGGRRRPPRPDLARARDPRAHRRGHDGASNRRAAVLEHRHRQTHLAHLYDKLGVGDRAAAAAEAMQRGLLE